MREESLNLEQIDALVKAAGDGSHEPAAASADQARAG
jgi:hypothetical protein